MKHLQKGIAVLLPVQHTVRISGSRVHFSYLDIPVKCIFNALLKCPGTILLCDKDHAMHVTINRLIPKYQNQFSHKSFEF